MHGTSCYSSVSSLVKSEKQLQACTGVNFYVFCPVKDKDGNYTVDVKFPQCKTFALIWLSLTVDIANMVA